MSYKLVSEAIVAFLETKQATEVESAVPGKTIVDHLTNEMETKKLEIDLKPNTIWVYLNKAAVNDPASPIRSSENRSGYFLDKASVEEEKQQETTAEIKPAEGKKTKVAESDLYPLVVSWLETKGYASKDVSALKSGGPWGNPDVLGALRTEIFGAVEIEVASCEVKLNEDNWQRYIFEAISHKRFSHRSWYCIRTASEKSPLPKGIEYYAERYKLGIVQIILSDDELAKLKADKADAANYIDKVVERIPALYEHVPLREVADVLKRSGFENSLSPG
ncbi:MAG: hypothetical protein Q7S99_09530 [Parvibaculum sp.]|nr:hypothetical protein [Parvibaculum sp.]